MKAHNTTALAVVAMLGCGAAFAAPSATQSHNTAAANCVHQASQRKLSGNARTQYMKECRAGTSQAYLAFNENRHATKADLGG
jgi:hypothetical protein